MPPKKRTPQNKEIKQNISSSDNNNVKSPSKTADDSIVSTPKHKDKDVDFVILCKDLQVTNSLCNHAWSIWKKASDSMEKMTDSNKQLWAACLFVAAIDMDASTPGFTDVQKAAGLNMKPFLEVMKNLDVNIDIISPKVNSAVSRLEKKYDVSLALYQRFEKIWKDIYAQSAEAESTEIFKSIWTMFLLAKGSFLQMEDDLVISFHLLICVLEFFIKRSPSSLLRPLYSSKLTPTRSSRRNQGKAKPRPPEVNEPLLEVVCKENECSLDEVKNLYETVFSPFLESSGFSKSQELPTFEELSMKFEDVFLKTKDFDGRLFLNGDEKWHQEKPVIAQVESTPKKNEEFSPAVLQTPVRATLYSVQQLRVSLTSASDQPSETLMKYFKNCTVNPTEEIIKRTEHLGEVFSHAFAQVVGPGCSGAGNQRFALGLRLYYRVMESMLKSEEKRLSQHNFSQLLNNSTFHTSLLSCSLEVVMATYGSGLSTDTDLSFPWLLGVFKLHGFDFYKVIESFIKAEPSLNRDMVKHLERCEHVIIESIAWRADSPLFELLQLAGEEGRLEPAEPPAFLHQPPQHLHTAADLYLSPVRPSRSLPPVQDRSPPRAALPSSPPPQPLAQAHRPPKSNSLSHFYKKLYRVAYLRLKRLCTRLLSDHPELELIIWTLLQHTLKDEYELLKDRHLDQLMMSAMYAICKVKFVDLRFKTIVTAYKELPNTIQETFKQVLISEGKYDSIIVFYNMVFMQKLKTNILQYASSRLPTLSPVPHIPRSPYKYPNSPMRVGNVYVSPMKSCASPMTPRSRILISLGESFGNSERFQKINEMVKSSEGTLKRRGDVGSGPKPLKRLRFDTDGQDEADGSKPSGGSALIQKLTEMSSTRNRMQEQKMKEEAESVREEVPSVEKNE
ncbi:retinoblastoma-associated protein isoform X2 [Clupea harengus]|uniref:Retinoblastoma-associated protein n=1 Tax=Clupea harengus TaxID=7950 RepID=A0A6P8FXL2_CLUHA|nr:retinoblastoma-associated protein isoform X2 [Clupea harengus]